MIPATFAAEYSNGADGLPNVTERLKFVMNYHHNQLIRCRMAKGRDAHGYGKMPVSWLGTENQ